MIQLKFWFQRFNDYFFFQQLWPAGKGFSLSDRSAQYSSEWICTVTVCKSNKHIEIMGLLINPGASCQTCTANYHV
jgi:hypothetical protein